MATSTLAADGNARILAPSGKLRAALYPGTPNIIKRWWSRARAVAGLEIPSFPNQPLSRNPCLVDQIPRELLRLQKDWSSATSPVPDPSRRREVPQRSRRTARRLSPSRVGKRSASFG